jgi:cytochrome c-type protein NapC
MWRTLKRLILKQGAVPLLVAMLIGAGLVVASNMALEMTSTESFCISCHEMRDYALEEYKDTNHDRNGSGVRATCPDCHVPKEFLAKIWRKTVAAKEIFYHFTGMLNTPEKYEEHRYEMALSVWRRMKANDSQSCRNCHDVDKMDPEQQTEEALDRHTRGVAEGKTCIDCHFAIAHFEPEGELSPEDL